MPLKSIREKISSVAGSETLGEAKTKKEDKVKGEVRKPKRVSKKPTKKESTPKRKPVESKPNEEVIVNVAEKNVSKPQHTVDDLVVHHHSVEGYKDVLKILGVKEHLDVEVDFNSTQLDYINFGQTTPLGLDYEEVTDFVSRVKFTLHKLESALKQREKDIVSVASEVKKIEKRMMEQNQEKELERMVGGMTEEERLIQEVMELRVEKNELSKDIKSLEKENLMLKDKVNDSSKNNHNVQSKKGGLPTPPIEPLSEDDIFGEMLGKIGGLYGDE